MLTYWETLIATRSNIAVSDSYAALWGKKSQNNYTVETYFGTLPATLQTIEGYLESYKIYGNTVQDGTPTPENPIVPSGCGVRTENLFLIDQTKKGYYEADGSFTRNLSYLSSELISIESGAYTASFYTSYTSAFYFEFVFFDENYSFIGIFRIVMSAGIEGVRSITTDNNSIPQNAKYLLVSVLALGEDYMLNSGSTALPYEPYGYKLPLTANGVKYPIYFGESQTTRRIKKLVLTGEEERWSRNTSIGNGNAYNNTSIFVNYKTRSGIGYCTHYPLATAASATIGVYFGAAVNIITALSEGIDTVEKWKTYLQQQYANGTPVTIWYVLAEPETGIVNEPLMKIGDYADTIDSAQSTVQIPTTAGETIINWAGEGLAPSEVELVYKVKR